MAALLVAIALFLIAAVAGHWGYHHRHAHKTIARHAGAFGWDEERRVVEIRTMKRRHGLRAKLRRKLRGRR